MTTEGIINYTSERVAQMLDSGASVEKILAYLTTVAESCSVPETVSSILLINDSGLLTNGASPKLPADYLKAIDGIKPDPKVGTCAAAAATGEMVITPDFRADDKWAELKHLPLSLGYSGAWSMPIKNKDGVVLGTFGTYFKDVRTPEMDEIITVQSLASIAANVLSRKEVEIS
jgi:GAF domain-containing protein